MVFEEIPIIDVIHGTDDNHYSPKKCINSKKMRRISQVIQETIGHPIMPS